MGGSTTTSGAAVALAEPPERIAEPEAGARWSPDLVVLSALLVLTMLFGRSFSKVSAGGHTLYVTELFMAALIVAAVWRCGPRGVVERMRRALPLVPLAILWVAAAIATLRGVSGYGLSKVTHDVGLLEYSLFLAFVAVVVDTRARAADLMTVLLYGSVASTLFYAVARVFPEALDFAPNPDPAACIYTSFVVAYVAVRLTLGLPVQRWLWPVAVLGLLIEATYGGRTSIVTLAACVVVLGLMAPRRRRVLAAGVGIVAAAAAFALSGPVADGVHAVEVRSNNAPAADSVGDGGGGAVPAAKAVENSFNSDAGGGDNANATWRLDYWKFMVKAAAHNPVLGVGFGKPATFVWNGAVYDSRRDDPTNPFDYTGPHNSFVHILYRTGLPGLLALIALVVIAARRIWPWRDPDRPAEERATLIQLVLVFVFISVFASLNVVLEGPQMGVFFWLTLGLLLVLPVLWARDRA